MTWQTNRLNAVYQQWNPEDNIIIPLEWQEKKQPPKYTSTANLLIMRVK